MTKHIICPNHISGIKIHDQTRIENVRFFNEEKPNWKNLWSERREAGFYYVCGFANTSPVSGFETTQEMHIIREDQVYLKCRVQFFMSHGDVETVYFDSIKERDEYVTKITSMSDNIFEIIKRD